jgi:hypothetical protein
MANQALILFIFIQELYETLKRSGANFSLLSTGVANTLLKLCPPFLFEFLSVHLPCSWSQRTRPCMFHFLKITSRISPDESTCRHVQALTVFLCKHNSEFLSPICRTSIEFRISFASVQMVLGRVRFDVKIGISLVLNYTD